MKTIRNKFTLALGIALLLQAFAPLIAGAVLFDPLIDKSDMALTIANIAQHPFNAQLSIFLDIVAVIGVLWLGVLFYTLLKKQNKVWVMTGLYLYALEAVMMMIGKAFNYLLIMIANTHGAVNQELISSLAMNFYQTGKFFSNMAMVPFGIGAFLFYFMLVKSKALPSWLSIWGLVSMFLVLIGIPLMTYGVNIPFAVVFPYVPFEFVAGGYILIKGIREKALE